MGQARPQVGLAGQAGPPGRLARKRQGNGQVRPRAPGQGHGYFLGGTRRRCRGGLRERGHWNANCETPAGPTSEAEAPGLDGATESLIQGFRGIGRKRSRPDQGLGRDPQFAATGATGALDDLAAHDRDPWIPGAVADLPWTDRTMRGDGLMIFVDAARLRDGTMPLSHLVQNRARKPRPMSGRCPFIWPTSRPWPALVQVFRAISTISNRARTR